MTEPADAAAIRWRELLGHDPVANDGERLEERLKAVGLLEGGRPICRVLRPRLVTRERFQTERHVAASVVRALAGVLAAVRDGAVSEAVTGGLTDWCRRVHELDPRPEAGVPAFLRLDASLARTQLHVLELNADMPAGEAHNDSVVDLFQGLPTTKTMLAENRGRLVRLLPDFRRIVERAAAPAGRRAVVAWVIWSDMPERKQIVATMASHLEQHGRRVIFADPRELDVGEERTELAGHHVGAILRTCSTPEILSRPDDAAPLLAAARSAHTPVLNPLGTEPLAYKTLLAAATDPMVEAGLSASEKRTVARHVPWTRVLRETTTPDPAGAPVDLLAWVREHRANLVVKPAHGLAGTGVVLGWRATDAEWDAAIEQGLGRDIVQRRVHLQRDRYPVIDRELEEETFYEDTDPFLFDSAPGGTLTRLSSTEITNVTAGGGVTATMVLGGA